jgi:tetratricopeptide (TPR) repeat protein
LRLRREHVVFALTILVLAWMARGFAPASATRRGAHRAERPELERHPAPDVGLALPDEPADLRRAPLRRELFAPPSDTHPLPPLAFEPPPGAPSYALRPPPVPGPDPDLYGRFLRVDAPSFDVPGLFGEAEGLEEDVALDEAYPDAGEGAAAGGGQRPKLTLEERRARIPGWKKVYDWILVGGDTKFGRIQNEDRFALPRDERPIRFVQFDELTGRERYPAIDYERSRVEEFGFADTVANRIELRYRELGPDLTAARYEEALLFANACVDSRLESPRALQIAEDVFRRAEKIAGEDPSPRIGVARCYEAGFRFEDAFAEYTALLDGGYAKDPRVLVPLARLEARFRLFGRAEDRLHEAERYGRTSWLVQGALGRFLLDRGRGAEALEHLRLANQYEPSRPELKRQRATLRDDLAEALVARGEIDEAVSWMRKALQADPDDARARAGLAAARVLTGADAAGPSGGPADGGGAGAGAGGGTAGTGGDETQGAGFELLLARGLASLAERRFDAAKQDLLLAAQADPLRASRAWRALSWLAEVTGYSEEALRYVESALENDPDDVWALFQHGRVLAARDDLEGAFEAFRRALDHELDFPEALAAMGEIRRRAGDHAGAERYLERALAVDPSMVRVHELRGVNLVELGDVEGAEKAFRAALKLDADAPAALAGVAWCAYRKGDAEEAIVRFRELDDNRRALPEDDPYRSYARAQIARLTDHLEKVSWVDGFERRALRNNWSVEEAAGPTVTLADGEVHLAGVFRERGRSRLWQVKPAGDWVALEARLTVRSRTSARAGIFVARESTRRGETQVEAEITLSRHPLEGVPQVQLVARRGDDAPYKSFPGFAWPLDAPVTLRIERVGDPGEGVLRVLLDGFPLVDGERMTALGRTTTELRLGAFVEGDAGREADVVVDDVEIVYREHGR